MADNNDINIQQLKEFFDYRMKMQDEAIKKIEKQVDTFVNKYEENMSKAIHKIDLIWKIGGTILLAVASAVAKALGWL